MSTTDEQEQHHLLDRKPPKSPKSLLSSGSANLTDPTQPSSARHRPGYARVPSVFVIDEGTINHSMDTTDGDDITQAPERSASGQGLGIFLGAGSKSPVNQARLVSIPASHKSPLSPNETTNPQFTPEPSTPYVSLPSSGGLSGSTLYNGEVDTSYRAAKHLAKQSVSSLHSTIQPSVYAKSDAGLLSMRSRYDDFEPQAHCQSQKRIKHKLGSWVSATAVGLALFLTISSALFLIIAMRSPRYGRYIHTKGTLTASVVAFLTSFLAKLIEISFVTAFIAFLGQVLARRAYHEQATKGVTLAELSMRTWIMQPGTMVTQWESVRYAGVTVLGGISLLAALGALLYGTAATALVQPQLKFPPWSGRIM